MAGFSTDGSVIMERNIKTTTNTHNYNIQEFNIKFDILQICRWINQNEYSKVCLQFPDEILTHSAHIYETIKSQVRADLFILGDTTYSSCCVDEVAAMHVQADAVVHFGHSCFSTCNIPVFTSLPKSCLDFQSLTTILQNYCKNTDTTKLCMFYDAAYYYLKDKIGAMWSELCPGGCIAHIDMENREEKYMGRSIYKDNTFMKIEELEDFTCIYLGSRSQTLFNCVISIKAQKWVCLDPDIGEISCLDESSWFKRRRYLVEKCKDAVNIGILVCKFSGQSTKDIIRRLQELCKTNNKKSYIISVGKPNVPKLANFPEIDVYVLIACSESDLYNSRDFYKPFVYPYELEVAVNIKRPVIPNLHITNFEDLLPNNRSYYSIKAMEESTDVSLITGKVRENKIKNYDDNVMDLEKKDWSVGTISQHLSHRTWSGLEQNLGETPVTEVERGRSGLPVSYENEPK